MLSRLLVELGSLVSFRVMAEHMGSLNNVPAFGFLGGKEAKAAGAGNLGLHDRECSTPDSEDPVPQE